jgi:hypothetical protein
VFVFTEGEVTEVSYLDAIKRLQDQFVIRVDDRHGNPGVIVPLAIAFKRMKDAEGVAEDLPGEERPHVWCVFDRDDHVGIDALIDEARAVGVRVAFSHPCFEFWLLLHFQATAAPEGGACGRVTDALNQYIRDYKRRGKRVRLSDIAGRYAEARGQAAAIGKRHDRDDVPVPTQRDPSTNVFEFVDAVGVAY